MRRGKLWGRRVSDVADFPFAATDLEKRIVSGRLGVGRVEHGTRPCRARKPAVTCQFSPLMSWTMAEPGQVSSDDAPVRRDEDRRGQTCRAPCQGLIAGGFS